MQSLKTASPLHGASRRGGVLLLSLIAVVSMGVLAMVLVRISISTTKRQAAAADHKQAFYLAEAALAEAFTGLGIGKTGQVGSAANPVSYGGGLFWVDAVDLGNNQVQLEATALWGEGRSALGLVAQGTVESVASLGIFSQDDLQMNPDVLVDSFDSTLGAYATQIGTATNYQGVLGSDGDLKLLNGGEIRGDVIAGTTGSVDTGSVHVTGSAYQRAQPATLPVVDVPDVGTPSSVTHTDPVPLVIPAGEHGYSVLDLGKNTSTLIQGPATLVVDELTLGANATLELDSTNGPIEIFITGNVDLNKDSFVITTVYDPTGVTFQVASDEHKSVDLGTQSTFYGFIYAPVGSIKLGSKFNVYGGIVAKSFQLATHGEVHYDIAIAKRLRTLPGRISWRVLDLPDNIAMNAGNPYTLLGVDPEALLPPHEAHADQWVSLRYVDDAGVTQTFTGWESDFDWSDAASVIELLRDGKVVTAPAEWTGGQGVGPSKPPEEPSVPAHEAVLLDALADADLTSADLTLALNEKSPGLSDAVLLAMLNREPPMTGNDMKVVLLNNFPSDAVLLEMIASSKMSAQNKQPPLFAFSPLDPVVLQAALDMSPGLPPGQVNALLNQQTP